MTLKICDDDNPCQNCLNIFANCKHRTTYRLDKETVKCVFCSLEIKEKENDK